MGPERANEACTACSFIVGIPETRLPFRFSDIDTPKGLRVIAASSTHVLPELFLRGVPDYSVHPAVFYLRFLSLG